MKYKAKLIIVLIIAIIAATVCVSATDFKVSCALDKIAADTVMVRSAVKGENVSFSETDFELSLGEIPQQIKISSLPSPSDGTLCLGNTIVFEGQIISRTNYPLLTFIPNKDVSTSSFEFTVSSGYTIECEIKLTDKQNSSPIINTERLLTVGTQTDIAAFSKLSAYDPDGDEITFEITHYPSKGIINITDSRTGSYTYTPYEGVVGVDSFAYRARDCYGNYSSECTVELTVSERYTDVLLADMDGHWAHNAALSAVAGGAFDVIVEMGNVYFDPDEIITREEYLRAVMISLGCGELPDTKTVFFDDEDISEGYSGYVAAAYKLGIVEGKDILGKLCFDPRGEITKAEAAVIMNRILGAEADGAYPVLSDFDIIPSWAQGDMLALTTAGILNGNGHSLLPLNKVTRAEAAQMIYSAKNLFS